MVEMRGDGAGELEIQGDRGSSLLRKKIARDVSSFYNPPKSQMWGLGEFLAPIPFIGGCVQS